MGNHPAGEVAHAYCKILSSAILNSEPALDKLLRTSGDSERRSDLWSIDLCRVQDVFVLAVETAPNA